MNIQDKTIIVTGAANGIGYELARQLLAKRARVAAVDIDQDALQRLQTDSAAGGRLSLHGLDITTIEKVEKLPDEVIAAHGSVDGLINCAGVIQPFVRISDIDYSAVDRVMRVNFYGSLYMIKSILPHLLKRTEAHIVNVSSMGGFLPVPGQAVYGASKAALKLLSEALYAELLDMPVCVTTVFPGGTDTHITENSGVDVKSLKIDASNYKTLSASRVAELIIRGIEQNKPQVFTGTDSVSMQRLYRLSPVRATKLIAKKMQSLLPPSDK